MSKRRVVVTGLGTINPLANNVLDTWKNLINGVSGIDYISSFETDNLPVTFAGEVKNFDANELKQKRRFYDYKDKYNSKEQNKLIIQINFNNNK